MRNRFRISGKSDCAIIAPLRRISGDRVRKSSPAPTAALMHTAIMHYTCPHVNCITPRGALMTEINVIYGARDFIARGFRVTDLRPFRPFLGRGHANKCANVRACARARDGRHAEFRPFRWKFSLERDDDNEGGRSRTRHVELPIVARYMTVSCWGPVIGRGKLSGRTIRRHFKDHEGPSGSLSLDKS